jgi:hypothetical protein
MAGGAATPTAAKMMPSENPVFAIAPLTAIKPDLPIWKLALKVLSE